MPVVPPPPAVGEPGWLLGGRYRVVDRIGSGGMADVFRAHDQLLARDVAVKVFRSHSDPNDATGGVQRQELELQTLARLSHPNLITLFDGSIGSDGEPAFLVMELIDGPSLAARIAQAPLTEPETREIAIQIAGALAYVHSQHMVHRDIKPANILLGADGTTGHTTVRARLSDFGIVRLLGSEHLTSADFMIGTASYLAPEQARGAEVGPAADVYALGLVLIEALTGRRSYQGPALEAVLARLDRSPEIPAGLPYPWPELLQAMTAMSPELRPSAVEVVRALRDGTPMAVPMLAAAGTEALPGLAGAAAAGGVGLAGAAALSAGVGPAAAAPPGAAPAGAAPAAGAGLAGVAPAAGAALVPGVVPNAPLAADPELATAFIGAPAAPDAAAGDLSDRPAPSDAPRRRGPFGARGPLAAAVSLLVAALATGGFLMVRQPAGSSPALLPGQAVASDSSKPVASAKPSATATASSLAPVGSISTDGSHFSAGSSSARSRGASSSSASSTVGASSSASASSSPTATSTSSSAPASSSSAVQSSSSSAAQSSSSATSSGGSSSVGASGTPSTSASPAAATSPTGSSSDNRSGKPKKSG